MMHMKNQKKNTNKKWLNMSKNMENSKIDEVSDLGLKAINNLSQA